MDVSALAQASNAQSSSDSDNGDALKKLSGDFDTFLTLLTTQLQNQDPLDPMDNTEMTNQLVSFANVEQQIAQNTNLEQLISLIGTDSNAAAVSYIGKQVRVDGSVTQYTGQPITFGYELPSDVASSSISVLDSDNNVVRTIDGQTTVGRNEFVWDGTDNDGIAVANGTYSFRIGALDSGDEAVLATATDITGVVTATEFGESGSSLLIGNTSYALTAVQAVSNPPAS